MEEHAACLLLNKAVLPRLGKPKILDIVRSSIVFEATAVFIFLEWIMRWSLLPVQAEVERRWNGWEGQRRNQLGGGRCVRSDDAAE